MGGTYYWVVKIVCREKVQTNNIRQHMRDSEINITDLDDYEVGVYADVEDIEFFSCESDEFDNEDGSDNI